MAEINLTPDVINCFNVPPKHHPTKYNKINSKNQNFSPNTE